MSRHGNPRLRMLREAQAAGDEAAATGLSIEEVSGRRAERHAAHQADVREHLEEYNDAVQRVSNRGGPRDVAARDAAFARLMGGTRRDFLRRAGTAAAGLAATALASGLRPAPARAAAANQPRVAIVGAGAAGLRCAHELWTAWGLRSTVYEWNTRIGGRLNTDRTTFANGQIAELHAAFISSEHTATLALAKNFNIGLDDTLAVPAGTANTFWINGSRYTQAELDADWQAFGWKAFNDAAKAVPYPSNGPYYSSYNQTAWNWDHMSATEWIDQYLPGGLSTDFGRFCEADLTTYLGEEASKMSALSLIYQLGYYWTGPPWGRQYQPQNSPEIYGSDDRWHLTGGTDLLITKMLGQLPAGTVQTGKQLVALAANPDRTYTLTFQSGSSTSQVVADHVVLAIPFTTLRNVDLSKAGLSPLKMTAINTMGMGNCGKVIMQFNGRPWVNAGYTGNFITDVTPPVNTGWEDNYQKNNYSARTSIFTNYPCGNAETNLRSKYGITTMHGTPPANLVKDILTELDTILPGTRAAYTGKSLYHLGSLDPYAHGAYSALRIGQYTGFYGYCDVQEGNIHFAGEHCSYDAWGYVEGAITTGEKAAKEIRTQM